jgi:hypothetical protein
MATMTNILLLLLLLIIIIIINIITWPRSGIPSERRCVPPGSRGGGRWS